MSELLNQCTDLQDKAPVLERFAQELSNVWVSNGHAYLQCCPECHRENYSLNVSLGVCYACGYDANTELERWSTR